MKKGDPTTDPKGLIEEAYRIDGIGTAECRSIFLDWALSLPEGSDTRAVIKTLIDRHGQPDHPMTAVLQEGLTGTATGTRRGGARGRRA